VLGEGRDDGSISMEDMGPDALAVTRAHIDDKTGEV
jgi:hypothetical protein